jgi:AraC-like DNA-binding protein
VYTKITSSFSSDWLFVAGEENNTWDRVETAFCTDCRTGKNNSKLKDSYEAHDCYELCLGIAGNCVLDIKHLPVLLREGTAALILPETAHRELRIKKQNYMVLWLSVAKDRVFVHVTGIFDNHAYFDRECLYVKPEYDFVNYLEGMHWEVHEQRHLYYDKIKTTLLSLLIHLQRHVRSSETTKGDYLSRSPYHSLRWKRKIVDEVNHYIKNNYSKSLKLSQIAQAAYELGFYDQYHFSRRFKLHTGCSPLAYRQRHNRQ